MPLGLVSAAKVRSPGLENDMNHLGRYDVRKNVEQPQGLSSRTKCLAGYRPLTTTGPARIVPVETSKTMTTPLRKTLYVGFAGLSIIGTAAACAPTTAAPSTQVPETDNSGQVSTSSPSASSAAGGASTYKDGTYSADGSYTSPNGQEKVGVELTLASGKVSAVNITTHPSNPNTKKFQGEFASGISAQVVGKNIDELNVYKVAGSSLTSGGFNDAVQQIKSQAK